MSRPTLILVLAFAQAACGSGSKSDPAATATLAGLPRCPGGPTSPISVSRMRLLLRDDRMGLREETRSEFCSARGVQHAFVTDSDARGVPVTACVIRRSPLGTNNVRVVKAESTTSLTRLNVDCTTAQAGRLWVAHVRRFL